MKACRGSTRCFKTFETFAPIFLPIRTRCVAVGFVKPRGLLDTESSNNATAPQCLAEFTLWELLPAIERKLVIKLRCGVDVLGMVWHGA